MHFSNEFDFKFMTFQQLPVIIPDIKLPSGLVIKPRDPNENGIMIFLY